MSVVIVSVCMDSGMSERWVGGVCDERWSVFDYFRGLCEGLV